MAAAIRLKTLAVKGRRGGVGEGKMTNGLRVRKSSSRSPFVTCNSGSLSCCAITDACMSTEEISLHNFPFIESLPKLFFLEMKESDDEQ